MHEMDITRTFTGICVVNNDEAATTEENWGTWSMRSLDGEEDKRPICEQFSLGHVNGWLRYEFTAVARWDSENMKYNQFKIDASTVGIIDLKLRMAGLEWSLDDDQGSDAESKLKSFWSIVEGELLEMLNRQEKCGNLDHKYQRCCWKELEPDTIQ